ncbi:hypothetical protein KYG33_16150 [Chryseobacterium sp. D764]|uniref:DUF7336 domain-containing protein n=1 Tax=unclassified Chryseobacterium TaxID=2593645 RepID=UPI0015C2248A|nr:MULTISPECIES: hypothetical protein [unclassified Chryseobacterium]QXU48311.1 hypothetical protein KYG33_16150 [Chryseobacterium sp. D764]CAD0222891.1 conserved protein of unknown function [Chryseobacterium sp. JV274]
MEYFIYALNHTYTDESHTDTKFLGFSNSLEDLEKLKAKAVLMSGFRDYPDCFVADCYIMDKIHWNNGFEKVIGEIGRDYIEKGDEIDENCISVKELGLSTVFSVSHSYTIHTFLDDERYIGVFSTLEKVEKAIEELKNKPGFKDHQDDFIICELDLATLLWSSGFGSV